MFSFYNNKEKSPIVKKKIEARISKKSGSQAPNPQPATSTITISGNYENMRDGNKATTFHEQMQTAAPPVVPADYIKYEELEETDLARKERISNLRDTAEKGPMTLQIIAFFGGMSMVLASVIDLQGRARLEGGLTPDFTVIALYTWAFGLFIMGLEGRKLMIEIHQLHTMVSNYMKIFRYVWGRGLFYIFAGSLQYCMFSPFSSIVGIFMMTIGVIMFALGLYFTYSLSLELDAVENDGHMRTKFEFHDVDRDGYITREQWRDIVMSMDLNDYENTDLDSEFRSMDLDKDGLLSYPEFKQWVDARIKKNQTLMDKFEIAGFFQA